MRVSLTTAVKVFTGALVAGLLLGGPIPVRAEGAASEKFKPGQEAPDFTAKDLAGNDVKLSSFEGSKVVVLNFWGLRCGACLEEMPYLEEMSKRYKDQAVFLGVDTDGVGAEDVVATLNEMSLTITYPLLLDPEFAVTDVYTNFLVPLTLVIDRKGVITYIHTGFEKGAEKQYEDALKKAL